jgi:hypothetical protein
MAMVAAPWLSRVTFSVTAEAAREFDPFRLIFQSLVGTLNLCAGTDGVFSAGHQRRTDIRNSSPFPLGKQSQI